MLRWRRALLLAGIRFFRLRGSNEKAARGFAMGVSLNFLPTFGLGGFVAGFLAHLVRGNVLAGFLGGSCLAPFWPLLFYLNICVGSVFVQPAVELDDLGDVTPQSIDALVWGRTFALGAAVNAITAAVVAYFLFLLAYERCRPGALVRLRKAARLTPSPTVGTRRR